MNQQQPVPADLEMTVSLQAQQWNVVIAALRKMPVEIVETTLAAVNSQLQEQAAAAPSALNGAALAHPDA